MAKIVTVEPIASQPLLIRLKEICHNEQISVENRALLYLAEATNYDLRSAINIMQVSFYLIKYYRITLIVTNSCVI